MPKALSVADLERFFMSRNEIASQHNSRLELEAMGQVREFLSTYEEPSVEAEEEPKKAKKEK